MGFAKTVLQALISRVLRRNANPASVYASFARDLKKINASNAFRVTSSTAIPRPTCTTISIAPALRAMTGIAHPVRTLIIAWNASQATSSVPITNVQSAKSKIATLAWMERVPAQLADSDGSTIQSTIFAKASMIIAQILQLIRRTTSARPATQGAATARTWVIATNVQTATTSPWLTWKKAKDRNAWNATTIAAHAQWGRTSVQAARMGWSLQRTSANSAANNSNSKTTRTNASNALGTATPAPAQPTARPATIFISKIWRMGTANWDALLVNMPSMSKS